MKKIGITPDHLYPIGCTPFFHYETDSIVLHPPQSPHLHTIEVLVSISMDRKKTLQTPSGKKLIFLGKKHIRINYETTNHTISVVECSTPLSITVFQCEHIHDIFVAIEDIDVIKRHKRLLFVYTFLCVIPINLRGNCICSNPSKPQITSIPNTKNNLYLSPNIQHISKNQ
ncbi:hypothetical protein [Anoxybacillus ayderensis]|uniref:hypothetical protein n=1 Tax=Anoxybacillus ayderensis TaxID=265546 RepID=UPI0011780FD6|nr:hypothetical protein [Anoxybacillus ayderensis]MED0657334.1 hypothetical protein [Anoxybacillus ayderensis]MED0687855.1 hypothetical protein [Anoxybacillus ayderensis]